MKRKLTSKILRIGTCHFLQIWWGKRGKSKSLFPTFHYLYEKVISTTFWNSMRNVKTTVKIVRFSEISCSLNSLKMERFQSFTCGSSTFSANIYLFKVNNENIRIMCEICSKLIIKTTERRHWHLSDVFIVNFE